MRILKNQVTGTNLQKAYALAFVLSCLLILIVGAVRYTPNTFDDAYNYLRYAKSFLAGYGQAYNPDDGQIYGLTSQLYFYYHLIVVSLLPFTETILMEVSSGIMGLLALSMILYTCYTCITVQGNFKQYIPFFLSFLALIIFSKSFIYHWFTGMDTTTSILMNATLIYFTLRFVKSNTDANLAYVVVASFLCVFTRPDNLFYATLFPGLILLTQTSGKKRWRFLALFSIGLIALTLADLSIKYLIFSEILPTTWKVKQNGFFEGYTVNHLWNSMKFFTHFITLMSPFIFVIILLFNRQISWLIISFSIPVIITFCYYFSTFQIMGFESRYYFPALGFFVIGAVISINYAQSHETKIDWRSHFLSPLRIICLFLLFTFISNGSVISSKYENLFLRNGTVYEANIDFTLPLNKTIGRSDWLYFIENIRSLTQSLPEGCKVATTETGRFSAIGSHLNVIDLIGFHNHDIANHGFKASRLMEKKPDLIFIHHVYSKMNKDLLENSNFQKEYDFYPEAFYGGIAIRKNSGMYQEIRSGILKIWQNAYSGQNMDNYIATFKESAS